MYIPMNKKFKCGKDYYVYGSNHDSKVYCLKYQYGMVIVCSELMANSSKACLGLSEPFLEV